ncbi:MAG: LysM peptidoglycan-binding domain-containing protein, partial [Chloroflexi bacterium]|nr:LysM peptidoglycan-binding domain-containing protein [Chloroflexota bacterium]
MKRLLVLVIVVVLGISLSTLLAQSNLTNLTRSDVCYATCFQGIQPGVTWRQEVGGMLVGSAIPFTLETTAEGVVTRYIVDWNSQLLPLAHTQGNVIFSIADDMVSRVTLRLRDVSVTDVLNVYGAPSWLGNNGSNVLVYAHLNAAFSVSNTDENQITTLDLVSPEGLIAAYTKLPSCEGQPAVCNVIRATAVPTNTPTFTPSPTPSFDVQDLRDLLTPNNCPRTCFLDIVPGVTVDYEALSQFYGWGIDPTLAEGSTAEIEETYTWKTYGEFTPLTSSTPDGQFEGYVGFSNGITRHVTFTLSAPISSFIEAYGAPDQYLVTEGDTDYLMVYLKRGMIVLVSRARSLDYSMGVTLMDDEMIQVLFGLSKTKPVRNCAEPSSICSVQTATPSPQPTFTPSPPPTATAAPIPPEPPLSLTLVDSFDAPFPLYWSANDDWFLVTEGEGKAFRTNTGTPITFTDRSLPYLNEVAVELRARFSTGSLRMELRGYAAELNANGQVSLFRLGQLMATAFVLPNQTGAWRGFRLSAVDSVVRVSVDGVVVAGFADPDPLLVGSWVVSASGLNDDGLTIDDVLVWWFDRTQVYSTQPPSPTAVLVSPNQILSATRDANADTTVIRYTVQAGDTFESIARLYNTSAAALAEANGFHIDEPL